MSSSLPPISLITGGNRGIGKSAALHLAERGSDVILTYRSHHDEAAAVVAAIEALGRRAAALPLDVGVAAGFGDFAGAVGETLRHWQRERFDYLINNAGIGIYAPFEQTTEAQFDELVNVHFKGTFFLTQRLLPLIADGGRIVNISSALTRTTMSGPIAYASIKGAVEILTRYLAKELGPRKITVNTLAPGAVETDFGGGTLRDNAEIKQFLAANTALGRVGLPADIGGAIALLLAPENGWINAQRIEASGGTFL